MIRILVLLILAQGALFAQDTNPLKLARLKVNSGDMYTNSPNVILTSTTSNAVYIRAALEKEGVDQAIWAHLPENGFNFQLPDSEGKYKVYAQFKDRLGNLSGVRSQSITLDMVPPKNVTVHFDIPEKLLNHLGEVPIRIEGDEVNFIKISNVSTFNGAQWRGFRPGETIMFPLEGDLDGSRKVYVIARDKAKNTSQMAFDELFVDREAPFSGKIIINENERFSLRQDRKVDIEVYARGADSMAFSEDTSSIGLVYVPYAQKSEYVLSEGDGVKRVFVRFKDKANNVSTLIADDIYLDVTAPQDGYIQINDGNQKTDEPNKLVNLMVSATGAKLMMISNSSGFQGARWQTYRPRITNWVLSGEEDGLRSVYVRFKDEAGNVSRPYKADIILERNI